MLQTQPGQFGKDGVDKTDFDSRVKAFRTGLMIAMGLFGGTVLGGVVGLFVYANSRTPNAHDGVFAVIQIVGVILGIAMGYLAAKGAEAQEQLLDASQRASVTMLKKYRPKPGNAGNGNVGQRVIGAPANVGEEFLNQLLKNGN
jgi:MFS family permease